MEAFNFLVKLLRDLRVEIAPKKLIPPTTRLEFLGITFDTQEMTMEISPSKMKEIQQELQAWTYKKSTNRREAESLIRKLQFLAKCVRPGQIFIARLIEMIRGMDRGQQTLIPLEVRRDIAWWGRFASEHNGISIIWLVKDPRLDQVLATDASKKGYGAMCGSRYLRGRFPKHYRDKNIALLEILAVLAAVRIWGQHISRQYFWIHVDNQAVATVLNTGASRDMGLQQALREIAMVAAQNQFFIKAKHIPGVDNKVPDWLSRWGDPASKRKFHKHIRDKGWTRDRVDSQAIKFNFQW